VFQSGKDALKSKSIQILITGGLLIGFGMQISGSCPGIVLVQLGAGVKIICHIVIVILINRCLKKIRSINPLT
jgi:uncharacterized membrane protein YedE/YeeE